MAELRIPYLREVKAGDPGTLKNYLIARGVAFRIETINWQEHPHKPETTVWAGYNDRYLFLHFDVKDDYIRAEGRKDQDPVWQDACVEFFVSVGESYRNFEFNCLGICLSAIGPDRYTRTPLDPGSMVKIIRYPSMNVKSIPEEGSRADWSLTTGIPLDLINLKKGKKFRCNFYKCGDKTRVPHYVSWSPIGVPAPDFHRPEWFGEAELLKEG